MLTTFTYRPLATAALIHVDQKDVIGIVGPWGSGKSTVAAIDLYMHCLKYKCDALVVRDTYPALKDSCVTKFMEIFGSAGELSMGPPPTFYWKGPLAGHKVMFRSAEAPEDIQKFQSVECGYAWLEEVTPGLLPGGAINVGIAPEVLSGVIGRVRKWGVPDGKRRIVLSALPPPTTKHWFFKLFYDKRPMLGNLSPEKVQTLVDSIALYKINPRENLANLPPNYYELQTAFLTSDDQVRRFIDGEVGSGFGVGSVYGEQWSDLLHIGSNDMAACPGPLVVGIDGGLNASGLVLQPQPSGRLFALGEFITNGIGLEEFGFGLQQYIGRLWGQRMLQCYGDPAIFARSQNNARDGAWYLRQSGLTILPGPQDPLTRISGVRQWLSRMGKEGALFQVHPRCEMLIEGFRGAYRFKMANGEIIGKNPDKNEFSHIHDAAQYALASLLGRRQNAQPQPALLRSQVDALGQLRGPRAGQSERGQSNPHTRRKPLSSMNNPAVNQEL